MGGGGGLGVHVFQGCPNAYFYTITIFSQFFSHFIAFRDFIHSFIVSKGAKIRNRYNQVLMPYDRIWFIEGYLVDWLY